VTSPVHVSGGLPPPTVVITPPWAPPVVVARADWPAPHVWPAPRIWARPVLTRSPWPAPVPALDAYAPPVDTSDSPTHRHGRPAIGRARSLAYTIAGVAAAAVGLAVVVNR
jgi:hypothetical protein